MSDALSELRRLLVSDPRNKTALLQLAQELLRLNQHAEAYGFLACYGGLDFSEELRKTLVESLVETQNKALMSLRYPDERFSAALRTESPPLAFWGPEEFGSELYQWVWEDLGEFIAHPRPILALDLRELSLSDSDLSVLAGLRTLYSLRLSGNHNASDAVFEVLKDLPMLALLDLGHCAGISVEGLLSLRAFNELRSLSLDGLELNDHVLAAISEMKGLKRLSLSLCQGLSLEGVAALGQLPELAELELSMTELDLAELRRRLPSIRVLPNEDL